MSLELGPASVPSHPPATAPPEEIPAFLHALLAGDLDHPEPAGEDPVTDAVVHFVRSYRGDARSLRVSALALAARAETLIASSSMTAYLTDGVWSGAEQVHQASERVSVTMEEVSASVQELSGSVEEISSGATAALQVADRAEASSADAEALFGKLHSASTEISDVVRVITRIAQQTKLLALNATIEAARAGNAGVGFRVVAEEVGKLAKETSTASEGIARLVTSIQSEAAAALAEVSSVREVLGEMADIQRRAAAAVTQQAAVTREISSQLEQAAADSSDVRAGAAAVAVAVQDVREVSHESAESANRVSAGVADLDSALGVLR